MKKPFIDLDAIVVESAEFKFRDKIYKLRPIDAQTFMHFNNEWASLHNLAEKKEVTEEETMECCVNLIRSVCPTIDSEIIRKEMSLSQIGALINLICTTVTGEVDTKKKVQMREPALSPSQH